MPVKKKGRPAVKRAKGAKPPARVERTKSAARAKRVARSVEEPAPAASASRKPAAVPIVAIGASAGGLAAIEAFLAAIPAKSGAAYAIIQHLDPTKASGLVNLLRKATGLPVVEVADGMPVRRDRIYVIAPGVELAVLHGKFRLLEPDAPRGQRMPVDGFFRSVADELGDRAVAVVLSGMGSDGLLGAEYVRDRGGLVVAQDPDTAQFDSMPRGLVDAGLADIVAAPEALVERILWYLERGIGRRTGSSAEPPVDHGGVLERIVLLLRDHGGNDFGLYKRSTLRRRVERRMAIHQIEQPAAYFRFLQRNPAEVALLFKEMLIGVTSFFRDEEAWATVATEILPALIRAHPEGGALRAWVPACSTGEEAYTLAILFREALATLRPKRPVTLQIFATDLNADAIAVARLGLYSASIENSVSVERRQRFFSRERGGYRIHKDVRGMVTFATHNVTTDPPFTRLDIITCRNLLIYLNHEVQKRLMPVFHYALRPGGVLFLGSAESASDASGLFAVVDAKARLYRRLESGRPQAARELALRVTPLAVASSEQKPAARSASLHGAASEFVLNSLGPAAVLVDANGEIVWLSGRTQEFFEPSAGQVTWSLAAMLREELRFEVARALRKAAQQDKEVTATVASARDSVTVSVRRLTAPPALDGLLLVHFSRAPRELATAGAGRSSRNAPRAAAASAAELRQAQAEAREARDALQVAREELGATLEEMQSTNEELQSTNEELTTSKEELQSMNEELQTINAEQVARMETLAQAQSDMNNLLNSTEIATIFLGPGLTIRRFTPGAASVYRLLPSDIGRPITDIVSDLGYANLAQDAQEVLRTLVPRERALQAPDGRWYQVRMLPYRTIDDVIDGVVLTFADTTSSKRLELALRERERQLHAFVRNAPAPILVIDGTGVVLEVNAEAERMFGRSRKDAVGTLVTALPLPRRMHERIAVLRVAAAAGDPLAPFEVDVAAPSGVAHRVRWVASGMVDADGAGLVLMGQDLADVTPEHT